MTLTETHANGGGQAELEKDSAAAAVSVAAAVEATTTTAVSVETTTTTTSASANAAGNAIAGSTANNATNMEKHISKTTKQVESNTAFLRSARAGDLDKMVEFLDTGEVTDINACNANGLTALHLAAKDGHLDIVRELLRRGAAVDNATKKGNSALHIASLAGQRDVIKLLVQHGADVNRQSQNGFTPLYMAAQENHDASVRYLLAKGGNQSLATEDGFTPLAVAMQQGHDRVVAVLLESDSRGKVRLPALHIAAKKDDTRAAALLLENDHNPDVSSKSGFTPLHIAAHYGNLDVAQLLLARGADVNYAAKHNITPMHVACKWGKAGMVELLIARGAQIDACTRDGLTPLHCAARSGHEQVIDMLAENGANVLAKTKNGLVPLHMAAQGEHVDAARILLYHKAPVDEVTVDYLTALHVAAHCGHVKVAKLLLDRAADANARALNGFTPLHIACKKNRMKVVELLLKNGASKEATTESGLTPLHVASFMGCMNIVIYLLQHEASADVPTVRGETPLHLAARANQTDIIRILLRNGAQVDARAREEQTPLHVAARLGNIDIVMLLLQHGANHDSPTKDLYTPLHIAAKEGQDEVAALLLESGARLDACTTKGFTPLHLAAKYGRVHVARSLLARGAAVNAVGKNGVTPLHVAAHYDHQPVALLLLEHGGETAARAAASNGHTPLHIAAKKNQIEVAAALLARGAVRDAESKSGFTPVHLAAQEGHGEMTALLLESEAHANRAARNGLTPLHLCAQEDRVEVAEILLRQGRADVDAATRAGFTPLHVAAHFGQINMVRYLLENEATVERSTSLGYTALHQAAQQGHTLVISLLLKHRADPNAMTQNGQTALNIANRLGYITVVETLKIVTETNITQMETAASNSSLANGNRPSVETNASGGGGAVSAMAKYKVIAPESMHETFLSDSEDEGDTGLDHDDEHAANAMNPSNQPVYLSYYQRNGTKPHDDAVHADHQQYRYMTVDDMKGLDEEHMRLDMTAHTSATSTTGDGPKPEKAAANKYITTLQGQAPLEAVRAPYENASISADGADNSMYIPKQPDNVDIVRQPVHLGDEDRDLMATLESHLQSFGGRCRKTPPMCRERFLVSFLVDARGGAMRGCRHSGVRVIVPPRSAAQPTRITCRYVKAPRMPNPPPLMEGEALVSRVLELAPVGARFLGPVILEVPHFASLRNKEREIIILRSDNGETWREHTLVDSDEAIQDVLNDSFEAGELSLLEDLPTSRLIRVVTHDFPHYLAVVSRIRQEVHAIGPDGGTVSSAAVPQVQAVFPAQALTKKIRVGLQAQPIDSHTTARLLGRGVAVSPVVTVEPRRRKFHRAITLSMPAPRAHTQGMINQYAGAAPTLRLLCSITGGQNRAVWEDVTGSTPLTFVNECVSFTTTVSARFWLMDCRNIGDACRMATELYTHMAYVPFMVKFVVFAKRTAEREARLSVFCMTDDKEDKTLEQQEHFTEVAKSRDVEILEGRPVFLEFGGNIIPVLKTGEQLHMTFGAFRENRLTFIVKVRGPVASIDDTARDSSDIAAQNCSNGNNAAMAPTSLGRISFMNEPKQPKGEPPLQPLCSLNIALPERVVPAAATDYDDDLSYGLMGADLGGSMSSMSSPMPVLRNTLLRSAPSATVDGPAATAEVPSASVAAAAALASGMEATMSAAVVDDDIHKADIRLSDICNLLGNDWPRLAAELEVPAEDVRTIAEECADRGAAHQAMVMLRLWMRVKAHRATGNQLEQALHVIGRSDVVERCIFNLSLVTDVVERRAAKLQLGGEEDGVKMDEVKEIDNEEQMQGEKEMPVVVVEKHRNGLPANEKQTVTFDNQDTTTMATMTMNNSTDDGVAETDEDNYRSVAAVAAPIQLPPSSGEKAALAEVRDHSIRLGIGTGHSLQTGGPAETPPPSPADFGNVGDTGSISNDENGCVTGGTGGHIDLVATVVQAKTNGDREDCVQFVEHLVTGDHIEDNDDDADADADMLIQFAAAENFEQIATDIAAICAEAEQRALAERDRHQLQQQQQEQQQQTPDDVADIDDFETAVPLGPPDAVKSTPLKVRTIKKHSRHAAAAGHQPRPVQQRPAVGDIEWQKQDVPPDTSSATDIISTLQLEMVTSPAEHRSTEPVVIMSPSDDYSGEIDEVILVQTPGEDDEDADEVEEQDRRCRRRADDDDEEAAAGDADGEGDDDAAHPGATKETTGEERRRRHHAQKQREELELERLREQTLLVTSVAATTTTTTTATTTTTDRTISVQSDDGDAFDEVAEDDAQQQILQQQRRPIDAPQQQIQQQQQHQQHVTFGSSSGSDVALHEAGAEPSDDEPESDFYHSNELPSHAAFMQSPVPSQATNNGGSQQTTTTTVESNDDGVNGTKRTTTTTTTTVIRSTLDEKDDDDFDSAAAKAAADIASHTTRQITTTIVHTTSADPTDDANRLLDELLLVDGQRKGNAVKQTTSATVDAHPQSSNEHIENFLQHESNK